VSLGALLWKDARREWRGREALQAGLVLVLLFAAVDLLSFRSLAGAHATAAALLWTPLVFGAGAVAGRGLAAEADQGTLDLLRSAPVSVGLHGWSRTLLHFVLLLLLGGAAWLVLGWLFALPAPLGLAVVLGLAAVGLAVLATLAAALAVQARARDAILPVLLVPAAFPLLQAGLAATTALLSGASVADARAPLLAMAGYDLLAAGAAWLLWPIVLEGE
jgi:heme exporter protein B